MKKYILTIGKNGVCTCNDTVNKVTCTFVKGWYFKTVKFDHSNYTGEPLKITRVIQKMTSSTLRMKSQDVQESSAIFHFIDIITKPSRNHE